MEKKRLFVRIKEWCIDHQDELAIIAGIAAGVGTAVGSAISKRNKAMLKEEKRMNNYIYDPSTGLFWKTRRRNSNDNLIIAHRKAAGEPLYKILSEMKLLK